MDLNEIDFVIIITHILYVLLVLAFFIKIIFSQEFRVIDY